ncbi:MAG: hypothetical protein ACI8Y4_004203 [Candidatus Poriferisodalaceae bacterium]|jgi:hypothetical protein
MMEAVMAHTIERPKPLEGRRFVGDKRSGIVYDMDNCVDADAALAAVEDLSTAQAYATFGPDELREARNRGYKLSKLCSTSSDG